MARRVSPTFTEVELEFMQVIWSHGEVSTELMQKSLGERERNLSDGSIRKILSILLKKGHLARRRVGRSFFYQEKVHKTQACRNMVQDLLKRAFSGSVSLMMAALFDSRDISERDIDEIRRLIEDYEREKQE